MDAKPITYSLSGNNGLCRLARASNYPSAIKEAVEYAAINACSVTLLNETYLGEEGVVAALNGKWTFIPHQVRYVVQAYCTGMGFVDSKHQAPDHIKAEALMEKLLADDSAWLAGDRKARIILKRA